MTTSCKIRVDDIDGLLATYGIKLRGITLTKKFLGDRVKTKRHYSLVCRTEEDMSKVHHWIAFAKPLFDDFYAWAMMTEKKQPW